MSFNSLSVNKNRSVNNLSRYVIGAEINKQEEDSGIVTGTALMGGISGSVWAYGNRKDLKGGFQKLGENAKVQKNIVKNGKNVLAGATEYTSKTQLENLANKLNGKKYNKPEYKQLKDAINQALAKGKDFGNSLKNVEKLEALQNLQNYNSKVANQMAKGSIIRKAKNATGITKLSKATKELAVKSGKFRGLLKGLKGNAGFAVISLGFGLLTDVIPAFQLGKKEGFKQLGKTTVKTGAEVAGWAAGSAVGAKAGAVVGSFFGPIGTVVGGAIGLVGGFVGSYVASKIADKVVGPSEVEIAENNTAKEIAHQAKTDDASLEELTLATYEQLLANAQNGTYSENDEIAKKSLENLLGCKINIEEELEAMNNMNQEETNTEYIAQANTHKEEATIQQTYNQANLNPYMPIGFNQNYTQMNPYMNNPYNNMPTNNTKFRYVG